MTKSSLLRKSWLGRIRLSGWLMLCFGILGSSQQPPEIPQETVNKRITEIVEATLQKGAGTTPDGAQYMQMRVSPSRQELQEVKKFGEKAIAPLSSYLDSSDYRAQLLAVNLLGSVGGKPVIKPLAHAAEHCSYMLARAAALQNLDQQNWSDVSEVVKRASRNDPEAFVRKTAQDILAKHESAADSQ